MKYKKIGPSNKNKYSAQEQHDISKQNKSSKKEVIWFVTPFSFTVKNLPKLFFKIL